MPGQPAPGTPAVPAARIVIECDITKGSSNLKSYGPLSLPMVIDVLMSQLTSLWAQHIKTMMTGLRGPSGEPLFKAPGDDKPAPADTVQPEPEDKGESVQ